MPRPGPRPYECVRRVWHSERHQAMRGKLVQEMIRIVSELHGSATQRNQEWQEKLPIVILRAEEIMYSKAHSEGEYMDFKTIRKRLDDAIDTIIRRDETTETETDNLLRPCIEAALVLGCVPRRASRSQRHNNPRCYLSPSPQDLFEAHFSTEKPSYSGPFRMFPNPNISNSIPFSQQRPPYFPSIVTPTESANLLVTEPCSHMHKDLSTSHTSDFHSVPSSFNHHHHRQPNILEFPTVSPPVPSCFNHHRQPNILESPTVSSSLHCKLYPLYHMSELQNNIKTKSESEGIDLNVEPDAWKITPQTSDVTNAFEGTPAKGLDLSLRLGPPSNSDTQDTNLMDMDSKKVCNAAKPYDMPTSAPSGQVVCFPLPNLFKFFPRSDRA